ncbi:hypothetical protein Tco_0171869 [Tanacetum coccineum]
MLKARKLSYIIRELKQSSGKEQPKKKSETSGKEKPQAILMIQSRQKAVRQKITQSFSPDLEIEAEVGGHQVHRMCIYGGSSFEILYGHCFNRLLRSEIRNQMVPAATSLVGFSGEIKWPLGHITLLVKIGDDEHSMSAWMDFMVGKIDVSTQRNHWKARVTKDTSSAINNARNDKIPSHGRNTHAKEQ